MMETIVKDLNTMQDKRRYLSVFSIIQYSHPSTVSDYYPNIEGDYFR